MRRQGSGGVLPRLGATYGDGGLLMPDVVKAKEWFTRSAKQGYIPEQYALGRLLLSDDTEVHDQVTGIRWLHESASYGNPHAQRALDQRTSPTIAACVTRLLYHLSRVIRDSTEQTSQGPGFTIDRKRRRELMDKRLAMGHKPDDHEDMQMQGFSM